MTARRSTARMAAGTLAKAADAYDLGAAAFKKKDHAAASRHFSQAVAVDPRHYRAWAFLGMANAALGKIDEAIENYRKCIELEAGYHKAFNNIGELYRRKGQLDYAAMVFKMATEIAPEQAPYFYNLGLTYTEIGMLPQAEEAFVRACELQPCDPDFASELAQVRFTLGQLGSAVEAVEAFLKAAPDHDRTPEMKARLKMLRRRSEEDRPTRKRSR